jgi:opacity protein-like surface antigen
MLNPQEWRLDLGAETRSSARTMVEASFSGARDELGGWRAGLQLGIRFRPGTRWQFQIEPSVTRSVDTRQYVTTEDGGSSATYGGRYLFGQVSRSEIAAQFRASVAVTPDLTLEGYFEPFASSGEYADFGELAAARTNDLRRYGTDGTTIQLVNGQYTVADGAQQFSFADPAFNVRSFRSNLVLRWEWRPGSTAYLVWQQNRFEDRDQIARVGPGGLFQALGAPGDNTVAIKVSYWLSR